MCVGLDKGWLGAVGRKRKIVTIVPDSSTRGGVVSIVIGSTGTARRTVVTAGVWCVWADDVVTCVWT